MVLPNRRSNQGGAVLNLNMAALMLVWIGIRILRTFFMTLDSYSRVLLGFVDGLSLVLFLVFVTLGVKSLIRYRKCTVKRRARHPYS